MAAAASSTVSLLRESFPEAEGTQQIRRHREFSAEATAKQCVCAGMLHDARGGAHQVGEDCVWERDRRVALQACGAWGRRGLREVGASASASAAAAASALRLNVHPVTLHLDGIRRFGFSRGWIGSRVERHWHFTGRRAGRQD